MDVLTPDNVYELQIDITSYCNSFCGACVRNINGGPVNSLVKLEHMSWDMWKEICNFCATQKVRLISFNGNFGDISSHPEFNEMLEYLYSKTQDIKLSIHTNGGARNTTFWKTLSKIVYKFPASYVTFSVDGLEDTNHIYRRGVDFNTVMRNAKAYISEGGPARWRMIVFDHNKNQLQEASQLAKKMGFFAFNLNRSFDRNIELIEYKKMPAGVVTAPSKDEVDELRKQIDWYTDIGKPMAQLKELVSINSTCPWQQDCKIQINQIGEVWPCCYFSMHTGKPDRRRFTWLDDKINKYGHNFNSLQKHSLHKILNHEFFQTDLKENFSNKLLPLCVEKCRI